MIQHKENTVATCDDFELNIKRNAPLKYKYTYPVEGEIKAIVVIVPGFGGDMASKYEEKIREYVAKEFSALAVHVEYHCFYSRVQVGAKYILDKHDIDNFSKYLDMEKCKHMSVDEMLSELDKKIELQKDIGKLSKNYKHTQTLTFKPLKSEYQNFGILQSLDHINALNDILSMDLNFAAQCPIVMIGSSHGGYISYLTSKLAPSLIDCVIDNSSYVEAPVQYMIKSSAQPEFGKMYSPNIFLKVHTLSYWNCDKDSPFYLSADHLRIRNINDNKHIEKYALYSSSKKTKYIAYHSKYDTLAPIEDKVLLYKKLSSLGFDAQLNIIDKESQVDGEFIKALSHGMDMSLKRLIAKELPQIISSEVNLPNKKTDEPIIYICNEIMYRFYQAGNTFVEEVKNIW